MYWVFNGEHYLQKCNELPLLLALLPCITGMRRRWMCALSAFLQKENYSYWTLHKHSKEPLHSGFPAVSIHTVLYLCETPNTTNIVFCPLRMGSNLPSALAGSKTTSLQLHLNTRTLLYRFSQTDSVINDHVQAAFFFSRIHSRVSVFVSVYM